MVTNAFIRRGVKVFKTEGCTIRHKNNMPAREGWNSAEKLAFNSEVEEW